MKYAICSVVIVALFAACTADVGDQSQPGISTSPSPDRAPDAMEKADAAPVCEPDILDPRIQGAIERACDNIAHRVGFSEDVMDTVRFVCKDGELEIEDMGALLLDALRWRDCSGCR